MRESDIPLQAAGEAGFPLIAAVLHATDSLGLLRAELARILGLLCGEVADAMRLESLLKENGDVRRRAECFVYLNQLLEQRFDTEPERVHWLRKAQPAYGTSPLLAIVDEGRLEDVVAVLSRQVAGESTG